ncbi:uncharacterized protein LOC134281242 [Saccostrea cucullata]|uniref:uncharacterized protein LOC134281242 n=1 Tax=Saccostrea cuccullata TaxID=36930 RepID=UPI002ED3AAC9
MEEVSRRKNCQQYVEEAKLKNCRDYGKIQYHCVINSFGNQSLEVCAPEKIIFGFCTEFNQEIGKILANYYLDCTTFMPPCEKKYYSSNAYLYKGCYNYSNNMKV